MPPLIKPTPFFWPVFIAVVTTPPAGLLLVPEQWGSWQTVVAVAALAGWAALVAYLAANGARRLLERGVHWHSAQCVGQGGEGQQLTITTDRPLLRFALRVTTDRPIASAECLIWLEDGGRAFTEPGSRPKAIPVKILEGSRRSARLVLPRLSTSECAVLALLGPVGSGEFEVRCRVWTTLRVRLLHTV